VTKFREMKEIARERMLLTQVEPRENQSLKIWVGRHIKVAQKAAHQIDNTPVTAVAYYVREKLVP
jgi:phage regulator Rha-like protein